MKIVSILHWIRVFSRAYNSSIRWIKHVYRTVWRTTPMQNYQTPIWTKCNLREMLIWPLCENFCPHIFLLRYRLNHYIRIEWGSGATSSNNRCVIGFTHDSKIVWSNIHMVEDCRCTDVSATYESRIFVAWSDNCYDWWKKCHEKQETYLQYICHHYKNIKL